MIQIFRDGLLIHTGGYPVSIDGIKLAPLRAATPEQLAGHGLVIEPYTPPEPEPPTPEEIQAAVEAAIQTMLDAKAKELMFSSIHTAIAWAGARPNAAELKAWGGACWQAAEDIRDAVLAGERAIPTIAEVLAEMPEFGGGA